MYTSIAKFKTFYQQKGIELAVNDERLLSVLKNATGEMNVYLAVVYELPISVYVPYLDWANCAIAAKLLDIYGESEKTRNDYEDAIVTLKSLAKLGSRTGLTDESGNIIYPNVSLDPTPLPRQSVSGSIGNLSGKRIDFG